MKLKTLFLGICFIFSMSFCGGQTVKQNQTPDIKKETPKVQIIETMGEKPGWTEMEDGTGLKDGNKVIYFVGYAESTDKQTAKEGAQLNASTAAAVAIKSRATKQIAKAWESIGSGAAEAKEQVMKGLESISAKNVDVSGLLKTGAWWRKVTKPNFVNGKFTNYSKPVYEYYIRYAMDYNVYSTKRDKVVQETVPDKSQGKKIVEEFKKEDKEKPSDFTGRWIGQQSQPSGQGTSDIYYYEMKLTQNGDKVTGVSYTTSNKYKQGTYYVYFNVEGEIIDNVFYYEEKKIVKDIPVPGFQWYFTAAKLTIKENEISGPWWSSTSGTGNIRKKSEISDSGEVIFKKTNLLKYIKD